MDEQLYEELTAIVKSGNKDELKKRLYGLDEIVRAEFVRRTRMDKELNSPYDNKPRCAEGQLGKFCLIEYDNVEREFETMTAFLAMSEYLYDRAKIFRKTSPEKYDVAKEFLDGVFNINHSNHLESIFDVYLKNLNSEKSKMMETVSDSQLNPAFIETAQRFESSFAAIDSTVIGKIVSCTFNGDELERYCELVAPISAEQFADMEGETHDFIGVSAGSSFKLVPMPSYWQYRNALNFYNAKLEELRHFSSILTGRKPSSEMLVHVHGYFNSTDDIENYRIKKAANIYGKAVVCPIGRTALADDFRANKDGITIYNPADPEIEIMMQGKHNIRRVEAEAIKARSMRNINERANPEAVKKMRDWRSKRDKLVKDKAKILRKFASDDPGADIETDAKIENAITSIDRKIHDALSMLDPDEVVFETLDVKDGKMKKGEDYVMRV